MLTKINIKYYYTGGALLAALLCVLFNSPWAKFFIGWLALSLGLVSFAYWFNAGGVFRKKQNGSIPWYISWGFVPFLLGCQVYNAWARKHDKVPAIQKIEDQLYLACRLFPSDIEYLKTQGVDAILDVTAEFDALDGTLLAEDIDYLNVPVLDHSVPSEAQLNQAINWLNNQVRNGKKVVVHCALGRGRSVLVLASYLACRDSKSNLEDVLHSINEIRHTARLNKWQFTKVSQMYQQNRIKINKTLYLIANPVSGGGKWQDDAEYIQQTLSSYYRVKLLETTEDKDAAVQAREAVKCGADIVVACGGDGTVNEVASILVNTTMTLGIIPMGTTNALAHTLFGVGSKVIPVAQAVDILIQGHYQPIDTAICNERIMLLLVGIGFEHKMIETANRDKKNESGQFAYLSGLWDAIDENQPLSLSMQLDDGKTHTIDTTSIVIANSAPFSSLLAQGNGEPNIIDGLLDITWIEPTESSQEQLLSLVDLLFTGITRLWNQTNNKLESDAIHHAQAKRIYLTAQQKIHYVIDGELFESNDVTVEVVPKSLKVFVPKTSPILRR
ncbi:diacylglycerol kinase family protein [Shewanella sp. HL-SH8]|uniref:diacylglycerol kinase family protein n=1 Tax=Shewanella sp. HL-SH8 TaxID=3436242 RepID=UPI003EBBFD4A